MIESTPTLKRLLRIPGEERRRRARERRNDLKKSQADRRKALEAEFAEGHVEAAKHSCDDMGRLAYELGWAKQICRGLLYEIEAQEEVQERNANNGGPELG